MFHWRDHHGELEKLQNSTLTWLTHVKIAAPWNNKIALVVGTQISTFKPSYLLGLSWAGTTTIGYTKKMCLMSTCIIAASVANMISPE